MGNSVYLLTSWFSDLAITSIMIYRILCTFLRWYMSVFYLKKVTIHADTLTHDMPSIFVCDSKHSFQAALCLAAHMRSPLNFIKQYPYPLSPFKKLILKALHIVPLPRIDRSQANGNIWKDMRDLITDNRPLVFFTDHEHGDLRIPKGAAKLAFHTESVFDFHLNIEIIAVNIVRNDQQQLQICFSEGIPVSLYEKEYKQHPARTIKLITKYLEEQLCQNADPEHLLHAGCNTVVS